MRGISAESLGTTLEAVAKLRGKFGIVGDQLFSVVAMIDATPALRRVLTDPSTESEAKKSLAAEIFGSQIESGTRTVLGAAVAGRWARARDLTDALETAGVAAWIRSVGSTANVLENELFEAGRVVWANPELRSVVEDRLIAAEAKATLLKDVFASKISEAALALLIQASAARTASYEKVLAAFLKQVASSRNAVIATIRAAYDLDESERERLTAALSRRYDAEVEPNFITDPTVVGGISISIGDGVVDATMSNRLEDARRRLAG